VPPDNQRRELEAGYKDGSGDPGAGGPRQRTGTGAPAQGRSGRRVLERQKKVHEKCRRVHEKAQREETDGLIDTEL
jgi:hypothetical protein